MHTLLARRLAAGRRTDPVAERQAVEDLWRDPLVQRRWLRLALRLSEADCERCCRLAAGRALAGEALRWLAPEDAGEAGAARQAEFIAAAPAAAPVDATDPPAPLARAARYAARLTTAPAAAAPVRRHARGAVPTAEPG
jgi:hypothetical protein